MTPGRTTAIKLDPVYRWKCRDFAHGRVWYVGEPEQLDGIVAAVGRNGEVHRAGLSASLKSDHSHFALIVETQQGLAAAVDKARTYPVVYQATDSGGTVSNSARLLARDSGAQAFEPVALTEFRLAGYTGGARTLVPDIKQLRAGEWLMWEEGDPEPRLERYYRFFQANSASGSTERHLEDLAEVTHEVFRDLVGRAGSRPIWLPLSGGLDSRLILCKLHELGFRNVQTFSYGPPGNHEARIAEQVADRLGVPWFFLPSSGRRNRDYFQSEERRALWRFADQLTSVPQMQDAFAYQQLHHERRVPADALLINGQSGDFTSGDHIPPELYEDHSANENDLWDEIILKHYSLWSHLKDDDSLNVIAHQIRASLDEGVGVLNTPRELAGAWDFWEWQERQAKYVVNGQRIYDFFGYDWELPLWRGELLDFWPSMPIPFRLGQSGFKQYLQLYDYQGLFSRAYPRLWRWPGARTYPILGAAKVLGIVSPELRRRFLKYARYFGHYSDHYQVHGWRRFARMAPLHRNAVSYYSDVWLDENGDVLERARVAALDQA